VRLALTGIKPDRALAIANALSKEIHVRSYLTNASATPSPDLTSIVVQADEEANNSMQAHLLLAEELYEMVYAALDDIDDLHMEILSVEPKE